VLAVLQVAEPGLEQRRVVAADLGGLADDASAAGDGRPLAARRQEAEVDVGVGGEVSGLAGVGVGVEDEVEVAAFLRSWLDGRSVKWERLPCRLGPCSGTRGFRSRRRGWSSCRTCIFQRK
jgi:hypothetical protein